MPKTKRKRPLRTCALCDTRAKTFRFRSDTPDDAYNERMRRFRARYDDETADALTRGVCEGCLVRIEIERAEGETGVPWAPEALGDVSEAKRWSV